ncbi:nitroreductase family protein [Vagococcus sp.]|uniref:nitroreductase family protein n=1 Tax=Vagococcus sp. TaxID=1933889 RepID=UPI002FC61059
MNETISVLQTHGTIRDFDKQYEITDEMMDAIISSSKQAPSWMNGQAYSVTIFTGSEKEKLAKLVETDPNQDRNVDIIQTASAFLLFNVNLSYYQMTPNFSDDIEPLLIGAVDASLALQNALVASESLGLGSCVIGGVRRVSDKIITAYNYPQLMHPLVGLAIGKPINEKRVKPRLSNELNILKPDHGLSSSIIEEQVECYNKELSSYSQSVGYKSSPWQNRFKGYYEKKNYPQLTKITLKRQGLL